MIIFVTDGGIRGGAIANNFFLYSFFCVSAQQRGNLTVVTYGWGIEFRTNKESTFGARQRPEIEFLDINLTKDLSLLLHAVHNPF